MILYAAWAVVLLSHMYKKEKTFFASIYQQVLKLVIKTSEAFTSSFNFKLLKLLGTAVALYLFSFKVMHLVTRQWS